MPELPEVSTICSQLNNYLPFSIEAVTFSKNSKNLIKKKDYLLKKEIIVRIERKGKFLIFYFDDQNKFLISHLGMSGSWRIGVSGSKEKHAHVILKSHDNYFSYVDPRRFGHLYFLNQKNFEKKYKTFPLDISEKEFDELHIQKIFKDHPNKTLKPFLLDQKYFFGVGNYIASEICARAKLLPDRITGTLSKKDCANIKKAIDVIIHGATKSSGTTFSGGYVDAFGNKGEGVNHLIVFYQAICQACKKTKVIKTNLGGRGTYHCPKCQK